MSYHLPNLHTQAHRTARFWTGVGWHSSILVKRTKQLHTSWGSNPENRGLLSKGKCKFPYLAWTKDTIQNWCTFTILISPHLHFSAYSLYFLNTGIFLHTNASLQTIIFIKTLDRQGYTVIISGYILKRSLLCKSELASAICVPCSLVAIDSEFYPVKLYIPWRKSSSVGFSASWHVRKCLKIMKLFVQWKQKLHVHSGS